MNDHETISPFPPDAAVVMTARNPDPQTPVNGRRNGAFEGRAPLTEGDLAPTLSSVLERHRTMKALRGRIEEQLRGLAAFDPENSNPVLRAATGGTFGDANAKVQHLAMHDALTGLPNRALLKERFEKAIAICKRNHSKVAVAFVDLDHFKQINDTQGHQVGDQVLIAVANRLRQAVRTGDTVARWGGDEMILLLPGICKQDARTVCERLKDRVQKQMAKNDGFFVTMSMGVAIFPDDEEDPEQILQSADAALLLAKNRARNQVILFGEFEELKSFRQKTHLRGLLASAVTERRIQVHYQPIVDARTGRTVGAEALARWHEEGHGWLSPSMFIPMAENMGLIEDLGRQVLEQALRHLHLCQQLGWSLTLSVNLSVRQLMCSDFIKDLLELTRRFALKPERLSLEIPESQALQGLTSDVQQLEVLSSSGFSLAIDDFGQGYSSLATLHELPVRELKIDMKVMQNRNTKKGLRIVQTIVELSRTMGLETVAEGVETQEQLDLLRETGVQRLQGCLFSRPLSGEAFLAFLHSQTAASSLPRPALA